MWGLLSKNSPSFLATVGRTGGHSSGRAVGLVVGRTVGRSAWPPGGRGQHRSGVSDSRGRADSNFDRVFLTTWTRRRANSDRGKLWFDTQPEPNQGTCGNNHRHWPKTRQNGSSSPEDVRSRPELGQHRSISANFALEITKVLIEITPNGTGFTVQPRRAGARACPARAARARPSATRGLKINREPPSGRPLSPRPRIRSLRGSDQWWGNSTPAQGCAHVLKPKTRRRHQTEPWRVLTSLRGPGGSEFRRRHTCLGEGRREAP